MVKMRHNRKRRASVGLWGVVCNHLTIISVVVLSGIVVGYVFFNQEGLPLYLKMVGEAKQLEEEIHQLQETNESLRQEIGRLQHDPLKLEELARVRLGMVRQGEMVYQFVDPQPPRPDTSSIAEAGP